MYCEAKAAFYTQDIKNSIALFLKARGQYKELLQSNQLSGRAKQKAEKRLAKLKDPEGKYCPKKLASGYKG